MLILRCSSDLHWTFPVGDENESGSQERHLALGYTGGIYSHGLSRGHLRLSLEEWAKLSLEMFKKKPSAWAKGWA